MSTEPFVSRAKALPAKRCKEGCGDENKLFSYCFLMLQKPLTH